MGAQHYLDIFSWICVLFGGAVFPEQLGQRGEMKVGGWTKSNGTGGDSDLSLFTNRVPAKNLPRILVPQKGKWSSSQAGHVVDNG